MFRDIRRVAAAAGLFAFALVTAAAGQDLNWFRGRFRGPDPRLPGANSFDGYFNFCRGMYYSNRREPGVLHGGLPARDPRPRGTDAAPQRSQNGVSEIGAGAGSG